MAQQKSVDTKVNGIAEPVDLEKGLVAGLLDLQSDSLAVFLAMWSVVHTFLFDSRSELIYFAFSFQ